MYVGVSRMYWMNWEESEVPAQEFRHNGETTYRCEHVPRIEEEERRQKPQDVRRAQRYDNGKELLVGEQVAERKTVVCDLFLDRLHRDEDRGETQIDHDEDPEVHHGHVELVRALRPVAQGQNETRHERREVQPLKDHPEDLADLPQEIR